MFGRRSHQRFVFSSLPEGTLQILRDVTVDRMTQEHLVVTSRQPAVVSDVLTLQFGHEPCPPAQVCVAESRPMVTGGAVRHKVTLRWVEPGGGHSIQGAESHGEIGAPGILVHTLPVRLLNYCATGCLMEAPMRVDKATIGSLRLKIDGREFVEHLRVVRFQKVQGGSSNHIGAEFLWIGPPTGDSLRNRAELIGGDSRQQVQYASNQNQI
jgi:hypothetical protein